MRRLKLKPAKQRSVALAYRTSRGAAYRGKAEDVLGNSSFEKKYKGKIQLIFTSPPFPLNRKKQYGNEKGEKYIQWLGEFARVFRSYLKKNGSIVMEIGNAWEPGSPVMSTLALEALLHFMKCGDLQLCQQFICYNPARLPSPAEWVNVKRIRVKDAYTHVWWMSPTAYPEADNRRVLKEYSPSMKKLLSRNTYNSGERPSQHSIGAKSFLKSHGGAIPPNVLTMANTQSSDPYQVYCRRKGIDFHPARMPLALPEFFVRFLTKPRQLVLDPFGGSNTTGAAAESLKRRWLAIEPSKSYLAGSVGRFIDAKGFRR